MSLLVYLHFTPPPVYLHLTPPSAPLLEPFLSKGLCDSTNSCSLSFVHGLPVTEISCFPVCELPLRAFQQQPSNGLLEEVLGISVSGVHRQEQTLALKNCQGLVCTVKLELEKKQKQVLLKAMAVGKRFQLPLGNVGQCIFSQYFSSLMVFGGRCLSILSEMLDTVVMDQKILYVSYACAEFCWQSLIYVCMFGFLTVYRQSTQGGFTFRVVIIYSLVGLPRSVDTVMSQQFFGLGVDKKQNISVDQQVLKLQFDKFLIVLFGLFVFFVFLTLASDVSTSP